MSVTLLTFMRHLHDEDIQLKIFLFHGVSTWPFANASAGLQARPEPETSRSADSIALATRLLNVSSVFAYERSASFRLLHLRLHHNFFLS